MRWMTSWRFDPRAVRLADSHYNRHKIGSPQFVPPGSCKVLITPESDAVWVTSWPKPEYVRHQWAGAWMCSIFRREPGCAHLASDLIRDAVSATLALYGEPPALGMVTFVDPRKVRSSNPGCCFIKAGFTRLPERTKDLGLIVLQLLPAEMPAAELPLGSAHDLFSV